MTDDPQERSPGAAGRAKREIDRARDVELGPLESILAGIFIAWVAIAVKAMLNEGLGEETGYILLMAGVVTAAWFGGLNGGLAATIVATVLNGVIFGPNTDSDASTRVNLVRQILFLIVATAIVLLIASRRAHRDRLADALDEVASLADEVAARDARLEMMLSASGTGFWEWDVVSGELSWSDTIFRQHGLEPGTAPDFPTYLSMLHPDDRAAFESAIGAALDEDEPFSLDYRLVWPDGSVHWIHGAARVFRDADGRPQRMIGTGQDITERRRVEAERDGLLVQERRAGEFREAFIDVISHELRTPITTILGLTQILTRPGRRDDPVERAAMLEDVRAESERLHRLVEDLLVLSRVERGRLEVDPEPLQPRRLLEQIVEHETIENPSIDIQLVAEPDLPVVVGEASYVQQIMRNLLGNAVKYTPHGSHVVVDARVDGSDVAVRVTDDGPGISPASRERLFELFYRDPARARTVAGSGIGLFVCASLVEAMGGRIWVRPAPTGGAEFGFTMRTADLDDSDQHDGVRGPVPIASGTTDDRAPAEPGAAEATDGHLRPDADEAPLVSPEVAPGG